MLMNKCAQPCLPAKAPCSTKALMAPAMSRQQPMVARRGGLVVRRAQENQSPSQSEVKPDGFVGEDNSGKSNIFPNINKPFISSPVSEQVASQGLGGAQGGAIVVGALVIILLLAGFVFQRGTGETLEQLQASGAQESLSEVARRLSGSSGF